MNDEKDFLYKDMHEFLLKLELLHAYFEPYTTIEITLSPLIIPAVAINVKVLLKTRSLFLFCNFLLAGKFKISQVSQL